MAESIRDRDPNAPQNPPRSVLNRGVPDSRSGRISRLCCCSSPALP